MKMRTPIVSVTAMVLLTSSVVLSPARAVPIDKYPPGTVQAGCREPGDLYFPPNDNGVYGCMKGNGGVVVCGGVGGYSKTCTAGAAVRVLPTQIELQGAIRSGKAKMMPMK
jgi:hypothetical protein